MITCLPLVFQELHKGSFNNNGRRSNLVKTINYLVQRKFLMISYNVIHLFFTLSSKFNFATVSFFIFEKKYNLL